MGRPKGPALTAAEPVEGVLLDPAREVEACAKAPADKSNSLTGSVYQQLRSDLLSGHYRPDEKLRAEDLRRRFNIGSSPIREALNRLLAEGFVSLEEQKGFRVAPVSGEELEELVRARCLIDGAAVAECIRRYETGWEEGLVLALHRLSRVARRTPEEPTDNPEWERLHRAFHSALVGGCGSRWLTRISEQLFDSAERYRLLAADELSPRNELEEHRAITQACLDRRADDAVKLIEAHYASTCHTILKSFPMAGR
jgi:GntR family carbon starvation induced transcriptional regulator